VFFVCFEYVLTFSIHSLPIFVEAVSPLPDSFFS
jgi:hypothetical protein